MIQIQYVSIPPKRIVFKSGFFVIRLWIGLILLNTIIIKKSPRTMIIADRQLRRSIFIGTIFITGMDFGAPKGESDDLIFHSSKGKKFLRPITYKGNILTF